MKTLRVSTAGVPGGINSLPSKYALAKMKQLHSDLGILNYEEEERCCVYCGDGRTSLLDSNNVCEFCVERGKASPP